MDENKKLGTENTKECYSVEIGSTDNVEIIEKNLFLIFKKLVEKADSEKFKLFSRNLFYECPLFNSKIENAEDFENPMYNIHYGTNTVKFTYYKGFWAIECKNLIVKMKEKEETSFSFPQTGKYLYSNKNGKFAALYDNELLDRTLLSSSDFEILDNFKTNQNELEQKRAKEEAELAVKEKNEKLARTVVESVTIQFEMNWNLPNSNPIFLIKELLANCNYINILVEDNDSNSYYSNNCRDRFNKKFTIKYIIPILKKYPKSEAEIETTHIIDKISAAFGAKVNSIDYDEREFDSIEEAKNYIQKRKIGNIELLKTRYEAEDSNNTDTLESTEVAIKVDIENLEQSEISEEPTNKLEEKSDEVIEEEPFEEDFIPEKPKADYLKSEIDYWQRSSDFWRKEAQKLEAEAEQNSKKSEKIEKVKILQEFLRINKIKILKNEIAIDFSSFSFLVLRGSFHHKWTVEKLYNVFYNAGFNTVTVTFHYFTAQNKYIYIVTISDVDNAFKEVISTDFNPIVFLENYEGCKDR